MQNKQDNTLAIISIVCGGLGFLLSLIPCFGFIGIPLGIIGLILGGIALMKAKDNGYPRTMSYIGLGLSLMPIVVSLAYFFTFKTASNNMKSDIKTYTSCDSLIIDLKQTTAELKELGVEMEESEGEGILKNMSKLTKLTVKLGNMQDQARDLNCEGIEELDLDMEDNEDESEAKVDSLG